MKEHLTTKHKVAFLKQKLNDHNTSTKVQNEILDLFIGFYTKEDFEIMVDTLLTGWNQIQKDFTPEQKEDLREANAILNKPEDNSNKDVAEAGKTMDQTLDNAQLAGDGFSFLDASKE